MKTLVFLLVFLFSMGELYPQFNIPGIIKRKVEEKTEQKTEEAIEKAMEGEDDEQKNQEEQDKEKLDKEKSQKLNDQVSLKTYSKFDFIAGEKVIFFDDFSETAVGDFPPKWNTTASGEVITNNIFPGNWFKMIGNGCVALDEGIKLPENYTIEFDVTPYSVDENNTNYEFGFYLYIAHNPKDLFEGGAVPGLNGGIKMSFGHRATYSAYDTEGYTISGDNANATMESGKKYRLSFWVQKTRLRVYQDQVKIFDLPRVFAKEMICNQMRFELSGEHGPIISNFRIAGGLPDMRSKLITEGKLVSYGIYFDVGKDVVKPESYGTLKGIADVLKENPTVRIKIIGHTDSDGAADKNLTLSKQRAESVKKSLVDEFQIDASRIETDGKGATEPIGDNKNSEGKAQNRRVEFIKL